MAFVDSARIFLEAGHGGQGCESHYRDKYMRHPRPDGGDGGDGGNIIFIADSHIQTLLDYRFKQHYKAKKGANGSSQGKKGKTGEDCVLRLPLGTVIWDDETGMMIRDLSEHGEKIVVAKGGKAGRGNQHTKMITLPQPGQKLTIRLELKVIADVGLVGLPNAGKSTLISAVSKVKSKIANYPFTTKQPVLGIVRADDCDGTGEFDFVMADLPGLIQGAHEGKGLGHRFLKHAERTKILAHVIDMAGTDGRDPIEDFKTIAHELEQYSEELSHKIRIIVANKIDAPNALENLERLKKECDEPIFVTSAIDHTGLNEWINELRKVLVREGVY